jgi:hypothetical protein
VTVHLEGLEHDAVAHHVGTVEGGVNNVDIGPAEAVESVDISWPRGLRGLNRLEYKQQHCLVFFIQVGL